jgi:protein involved in polysaccharide export with SLBB domain
MALLGVAVLTHLARIRTLALRLPRAAGALLLLGFLAATTLLAPSATAQELPAGLSREQVMLMMSDPGTQQMMLQMQSANMQGAAAGVPFAGAPGMGGFGLNSNGMDTNMLTYGDTVLAIPFLLARLDSLDSLARTLDSIPKRYERRIFFGEKADLFGSTTNRVGRDYPLKAGDKMVLSLWGDVEKQLRFTLDNDGGAFVEGIGRVALNGLVLDEAEKAMLARLGKIYSGIRGGSTKAALQLETLSPLKVFILGEAEVPGGYVFHGNTSLMLALYYAQGPNAIGTVRRIELARDGKKDTVDLYDYLFRGITPKGSLLKDGDIVYLPRAERLVEVVGDVGRPGIYELKAGEGMRELLAYSGGINASVADQAVVLERIDSTGRRDYQNLEAVRKYATGAATYEMADGDVVHVPKSTLGPRDHVTVLGAVHYPGTYQYAPALTLDQAITIAGGPREEAFLGRVQVLRATVEGPLKLYSQALSGGSSMALEAQDTLVVYSQRELYRADSVSVTGAVARAGTYPYYEGMTVKDLVLLGGGFLAHREKGKVRLERRLPNSRTIEVKELDIDDGYLADDHQLKLQPGDRLAIPTEPNWYPQEVVHLDGAFRKPGEYSLEHSSERISQLLARTAGWHEEAYLDGARFFRHSLEKVTVGKGYTARFEMRDSIFQVGFDLRKALKGDKEHDIPLQSGDSLWLPRLKVSVKVSGEVGAPSHVLWREGEDPEYYIARAGGLTRASDREHIYVIYANGEKTTLDYMPRPPDPGTEILVPRQPPPTPTDWLRVMTAVASILSSFAALALAMSQL